MAQCCLPPSQRGKGRNPHAATPQCAGSFQQFCLPVVTTCVLPWVVCQSHCHTRAQYGLYRSILFRYDSFRSGVICALHWPRPAIDVARIQPAHATALLLKSKKMHRRVHATALRALCSAIARQMTFARSVQRTQLRIHIERARVTQVTQLAFESCNVDSL